MLELNKIHHGDSLSLMANINDKSIDFILCDLPYGTTSCSWDIIIPFNHLWYQYNRIIKPNGTICLFGIEPFTSSLILSNVDNFKEKLTWIKHRPSNIGCAKIRHLKYTEDVIIFNNSTNYYYNPQKQPRISPRIKDAQNGNSMQWRTNKIDTHDVSFASNTIPRSWNTFDAEKKYPPNYLTIPAVVSNSKEKTIHPTQKPIELFKYLILTYSKVGEIVLDNCIGSGTTAIASIKTRRNYIGIEKERKYVDIANKRIADIKHELIFDF